MQGKILTYDKAAKTGIIAGYDGNRYEFVRDEYKNDILSIDAAEVDFVVDGQQARDIYLLNPAAVMQVKTSSLAITSLVFGLVGLFSSWYLLAIPSILAIVFGHIAHSKIKYSKGRLGGRELATIGLILGYVVTVLSLIIVVGVIGFIGALATASQ